MCIKLSFILKGEAYVGATLQRRLSAGNSCRVLIFQAVKSKLMATFPLSEKQVDTILKSKRVVLKKNTDEATAKRLGGALKRAGMDIVLTKSSVAAATVTPAPLPMEASPEEKEAEQDPGKEKQEGTGLGMPTDTLSKEPQSQWEPSEIPFEFSGIGNGIFQDMDSQHHPFHCDPGYLFRHGPRSGASSTFTGTPA